MRPQDQAVLENIGWRWTDLGTPNNTYAARDKSEDAPSKTILKRLVDAGLIECRTATYRPWGGDKARNGFLREWGVDAWSQLTDEGRAAYRERFADRVRIEARLTAQGGDVKDALR